MRQVIFSIMILLTVTIAVQAQEKTNSLHEAIETKNFVFKAQSVNPSRGMMRQLTSDYDLLLSGDSAVSFLPYFGRAFTAPINSSEGGIKFTSTDFNYKVSERKKNGWEIQISPKDVSDIRDMYLTVFDNGRATLRVTSTNRETISFNGFVQEGKIRAKKPF